MATNKKGRHICLFECVRVQAIDQIALNKKTLKF